MLSLWAFCILILFPIRLHQILKISSFREVKCILINEGISVCEGLPVAFLDSGSPCATEFCAAHCKFGLERLYRKKVYYYHLLQTFLWWHLTNDVALVRDPIASAFQISQFMNKTPLPLLTCLGYCTRKTGNDRLCTQQCSFQASDL